MSDYEQDLHIDDTALDIEWLEQPKLMLKYTEIASSLRRDLDQEKEKLSLARAELDRDIRQDPDNFNIQVKITEAVINGCILEQKKYKEAMTNQIDAQYELNSAKGAVSAVEDRKAALENLVKLFGMGYFAGPKVPRELDYGQREVINEGQKEMKEKRSNSSIKIKRRRS